MDHILYLLDLYIFTPDDLELNKKAIMWPKTINPIFDQNDEVITFFVYFICNRKEMTVY